MPRININYSFATQDNPFLDKLGYYEGEEINKILLKQMEIYQKNPSEKNERISQKVIGYARQSLNEGNIIIPRKYYPGFEIEKDRIKENINFLEKMLKKDGENKNEK